MLVLTRGINEKIVIETDHGIIVVTLAKIVGRKARIAIEAPADVRILREELTGPKTERVGGGFRQ